MKKLLEELEAENKQLVEGIDAKDAEVLEAKKTIKQLRAKVSKLDKYKNNAEDLIEKDEEIEALKEKIVTLKTLKKENELLTEGVEAKDAEITELKKQLKTAEKNFGKSRKEMLEKAKEEFEQEKRFLAEAVASKDKELQAINIRVKGLEDVTVERDVLKEQMTKVTEQVNNARKIIETIKAAYDQLYFAHNSFIKNVQGATESASELHVLMSEKLNALLGGK